MEIRRRDWKLIMQLQPSSILQIYLFKFLMVLKIHVDAKIVSSFRYYTKINFRNCITLSKTVRISDTSDEIFGEKTVT